MHHKLVHSCALFVASSLLAASSATAQCELGSLLPQDLDLLDLFGDGLAHSNGHLAVAAPGLFPFNNEEGRVFMYERNGSGWSLNTTLLDPTSVGQVRFGDTLSLDADTLAVGQLFGGLFHVFDFDGSSWSLTQSVNPSTTTVSVKVALSGSWIVSGAPSETLGTTSSGAATFHELTPGGWVEQQLVAPSVPSKLGQFGAAVALEGTRAVIGAPLSQSETTGNLKAGDVYVFEYDGSSWNQTARLIPSIIETGQKFGFDLALEGDRLLIGTEQITPSNGSARVYVFEFDGNSWNETAILADPDVDAGDFFGRRVSLQGDLAVVTSQNDDEGIVGGGTVAQTGSVFVFQEQGGAWSQIAKLVASDARPDLQFGNDALLVGDQLIIGLQGESDIGGVRIWGLDGRACGLGGAAFTASLSTGASIDLQLAAGAAAAGKLYFVGGTTAGTLPGLTIGGVRIPLNDDGPGGYLQLTLLAPNTIPLLNSFGNLDAAGNATATFVVPALSDPSLAGLTIHHAAVVFDNPGAGGITRATNASHVLIVD